VIYITMDPVNNKYLNSRFKGLSKYAAADVTNSTSPPNPLLSNAYSASDFQVWSKHFLRWFPNHRLPPWRSQEYRRMLWISERANFKGAV